MPPTIPLGLESVANRSCVGDNAADFPPGIVKASSTQLQYTSLRRLFSPEYLFSGGSTGDSPVPLGDSPDGMASRAGNEWALLANRTASPVPLGESPSEAGGSPAPPMKQEQPQRGCDPKPRVGPSEDLPWVDACYVVQPQGGCSPNDTRSPQARRGCNRFKVD